MHDGWLILLYSSLPSQRPCSSYFMMFLGLRSVITSTSHVSTTLGVRWSFGCCPSWSMFLNHFGSYKIADNMRIDPVFAALMFHQMIEVDWFLSVGPYFIAYKLAPVLCTVIHLKNLLRWNFRTLISFQFCWCWHLSLTLNDDQTRLVRRFPTFNVSTDGIALYFMKNDGFRSDAPAELVDDLGDVSAQEELWEIDGGSSFLTDVCLVTATIS